MLARWIRGIGWAVLTLVLAGALMMASYRSAVGRALWQVVPQAWWSWLQQLSGVQGAESWADVEALVVAVACLLLAAIVVAGVARLRRGRTRAL